MHGILLLVRSVEVCGLVTHIVSTSRREAIFHNFSLRPVCQVVILEKNRFAYTTSQPKDVGHIIITIKENSTARKLLQD